MRHCDLYFCLATRRPEMIFGTREEADAFIIDNGGLVVEGLGAAPVRSVFCSGCGGWHVEGDLSEAHGEGLAACKDDEESLPESVYSLKESRKAYYNALAERASTTFYEAGELMSTGYVDEAEKMLWHIQAEIQSRSKDLPVEKMDELKDGLEAGLGRVAFFRELFRRLTREIEKAKILMSSCRLDEAKDLLSCVLCELETLGNGNKEESWASRLEGRARSCLSLIARFEEISGDPEAEKEVMDSEAGTKMDVLFRQMVTNGVVIRETERFFSEVEQLIEQMRGRAAEEKVREIKGLINRLDGPGTKQIRSSLEDRLFRLEVDLDDVLADETGPVEEQRRFLVRAIDRAALADCARKGGNEMLCKNFVTEARLFLARVAECKEKDMVESFLMALTA